MIKTTTERPLECPGWCMSAKVRAVGKGVKHRWCVFQLRSSCDGPDVKRRSRDAAGVNPRLNLSPIFQGPPPQKIRRAGIPSRKLGAFGSLKIAIPSFLSS